MTTIYALLALFITLQAADAITTIYGVRNGLSEANPIMRKVFSALGLYGGLVVMKVPISAVVIYYAIAGQFSVTGMWLLVVPFAALLVNNLYWIVRAKRELQPE